MLCGTPVIAFNRGSMPELIIDKETGFLVSTIDEAVSAVYMLSDINRKKCRNWVLSRFTKEKMIKDYLKVYNKILDNS